MGSRKTLTATTRVLKPGREGKRVTPISTHNWGGGGKGIYQFRSDLRGGNLLGEKETWDQGMEKKERFKTKKRTRKP